MKAKEDKKEIKQKADNSPAKQMTMLGNLLSLKTKK